MDTQAANACREFYMHILAQLVKTSPPSRLLLSPPLFYLRSSFSSIEYTACVFHVYSTHFREKTDKDFVEYFIELTGSRISKTTQRSMASLYLCNCWLHYSFQAFSLCLPDEWNMIFVKRRQFTASSICIEHSSACVTLYTNWVAGKLLERFAVSIYAGIAETITNSECMDVHIKSFTYAHWRSIRHSWGGFVTQLECQKRSN